MYNVFDVYFDSRNRASGTTSDFIMSLTKPLNKIVRFKLTSFTLRQSASDNKNKQDYMIISTSLLPGIPNDSSRTDALSATAAIAKVPSTVPDVFGQLVTHYNHEFFDEFKCGPQHVENLAVKVTSNLAAAVTFTESSPPDASDDFVSGVIRVWQLKI
jgi:hypothetical protein